jgi:Xaa-Pro aminopeptidase
MMTRMFDIQTYVQRREALARTLGDGLVLLQGSPLVPRNYPDNVFVFRQSSHVLYYAGVSRPDVWVLLDGATGETVLYGPPWTMDDVVWCGEQPTLADLAGAAGIADVAAPEVLAMALSDAAGQGRVVHYLPPYRASMEVALSRMLGTPLDDVKAGASADLVAAVAEQRLVKSAAEVAEIEDALGVTRDMFVAAMAEARPGLIEADIAGLIQGIALRRNRQQTFLPITTVSGEVLHNESRHQVLGEDQLLCIDSGAESPEFYASDITRTFPVRGRFDARQRAVYEVVLASQKAAIAATRPGVSYRDVHLTAARVITEGLIEVGLMKGDVEAAVAAGAHALFFPHGLGHALGLDVHDMEDLGDTVGYGRGVKRDPQFGLAALRFARELKPGYVMTAEPGVYFIPALIDQWAAEGKAAAFIDYDAVGAFRDFGGIRIEDDVLVTEEGSRVLGPGIPREIEEIEAIASM